MKPEFEVRTRVRTLLVEELNRRLEERTNRVPTSCVHNHRNPLDNRKQVEGEANEDYNRITDHRALPVVQTIGLCMLGADDPESWQGTICEDPIDAKRCPDFTLKQDKLAILEEFREELSTPGWVHENMPEVATLCWVLGEIASETAKVPWWKVLWVRWVLKVKVEDLVAVTDPVGLLPSPEEAESDEGISS